MTWEDVINSELEKPYFQSLVQFLKKEDHEKTILPPKDQRLSAFKLTPLDRVKAVIIGQDPYHNHQQAHGLAFSVLTNDLPPSLINIFKELQSDLKLKEKPHKGNLSPWAKAGVLLLNTTLTVELHKPLSHQHKGWEIFTHKIIEIINEKNTPVVFILWGKHAQQFEKIIDKDKHLILKAPHPSPLSAYRGFFGSKPFSKTNAFLKSKGIKPIDWSL